MAVPGSVDAARLAREHLESASPDMLRAMVETFAEALMSAEADAPCGAAPISATTSRAPPAAPIASAHRASTPVPARYEVGGHVLEFPDRERVGGDKSLVATGRHVFPASTLRPSASRSFPSTQG